MGMALGLLQLSDVNSKITSSIAIFHRPDIPSQFAIGRNDTEPSVAAEKQDHQDCPLTSSMICCWISLLSVDQAATRRRGSLYIGGVWIRQAKELHMKCLLGLLLVVGIVSSG